MSVLTAYTIHSTALRKAQENEALREEISTEPSFTYSDEDRDKFVTHMTAGVQLSLKPAEDAIIAKTDELIDSQNQLERVLEEESNRVQKAEAVVNQVQQIMMKVPQYRQKLVQIKKDMANIQRRTSKLSAKSLQLKAARDKIVASERQQAAKLANLEARVVTTTPTPSSSGSGSGKVAVVRD